MLANRTQMQPEDRGCNYEASVRKKSGGAIWKSIGRADSLKIRKQTQYIRQFSVCQKLIEKIVGAQKSWAIAPPFTAILHKARGCCTGTTRKVGFVRRTIVLCSAGIHSSERQTGTFARQSKTCKNDSAAFGFAVSEGNFEP